jgi:hypothetical protein
MKPFKKPNLILGLFSFLLLFIGITLRANGFKAGDYVLGLTILCGLIHWIWAIIDVFKNYRVNSGSENRILWIILVVIVPPIGGICYYTMSKTVRM